MERQRNIKSSDFPRLLDIILATLGGSSIEEGVERISSNELSSRMRGNGVSDPSGP